MIRMQTYLNVADNSGAKKVMCICTKANRKHASIGDIISVVIKEASSSTVIDTRKNTNPVLVKKSEMYDAVIVRTKYSTRRSNGMRIQFDDNAVVLIDKEKNPKGTRIFGPIAEELRFKGFTKIISLARFVV